MARLILLSISMFLLLALAFESSIASPYPDDEDAMVEKVQVADDDDETFNIINKENVMKQDGDDDDGDDDDKGGDKETNEQAVQEEEDEENAVALANVDNEVNADIEQAGACGCDLKVYDRRRYRGRMLLLRQQNADFRNDYFNDRVESIKVEGRCKWLIYQHINFLGTSYVLNPGRYYKPSRWGGKANQISSARALPPWGTKAIVLFQHSNFRGRMLTLYNSHRNFLKLNFNDKVSSFIITGGVWRLYQHIKFKGKGMTRHSGKYPSIVGSWYTPGNDQISSVKRIK